MIPDLLHVLLHLLLPCVVGDLGDEGAVGDLDAGLRGSAAAANVLKNNVQAMAQEMATTWITLQCLGILTRSLACLRTSLPPTKLPGIFLIGAKIG